MTSFMGPSTGRLLDARDKGAVLKPGYGQITDEDESPYGITSPGEMIKLLQAIPGLIPDATDMGGGATEAVTNFLGPGKIPDKLARMLSTDTFKTKMAAMGMSKAGDEFAERYPRIAAHMNPSKIEGMIDGKTTWGKAMVGQDPNPTIDVKLNPLSPNLRDTIAHEGTHVAQRLGMGKRMPQAYIDADEIVGYADNPFEQSARSAAKRYGLGKEGRSPYKLKEGLEDTVRKATPGTLTRLSLAAALRR